MEELKCPKCGSHVIITTLKDRWCRKCGYRTDDKTEFEEKAE